MNEASWSAKGSGVRGAVGLLQILEKENRRVWPEAGLLLIEPDDGLEEMDVRLIRDLKPELMVLSSFTPQERAGIMHVYPDADLVHLQTCRAALDAWDRFSALEQAILEQQPLTVSDIVQIDSLRSGCGGSIVKPDPSISETNPQSR